MISKKIRMSLMGSLIVGMAGYLAYDMLIDTPSRPTPQAPTPQIVIPSDDVLAQTPTPQPIAAPMVEQPKTEAKEVVVFELSPKAELALDELQRTYFAKLRDARLKAEIAEKKSQRELDEYSSIPNTTPPPRRTPQSEPLTNVVINQVEIKSIVKTPNRTTAWIGSLNGQSRPIQVGAWVGDAKVIEITSNSVRFERNGQYIRKYVAAPLPIAKEKRDVKKYKR
ncbi:hypothetical protein ACP6H1_27280 [Vibrio harveyi]|uniref:hypothetical protein n=1 Tax=Vibrio harveyi TaxID=669 RepID=UPI003CF60CF0